MPYGVPDNMRRDLFEDYDWFQRDQADRQEELLYGLRNEAGDRLIPVEEAQPPFPSALYHRADPFSPASETGHPDYATGHRDVNDAAPYIPARLMKQVEHHYNSDTWPEIQSDTFDQGERENKDTVDFLLHRLRESRLWPRSLQRGYEPEPPTL